MTESGNLDINRFYAIGINFKKSDAAVRGQFAFSNGQYAQFLQTAQELSSKELFLLSTCNRTEIYGFATDPGQLINLFCRHTNGNPEIFRSIAYTKQGANAIYHLFEVGAGLDSQILGDYEIIGQLKTAVKIAKDHGFVGSFLERLINAVLQASKQIKNQTQLSGGTVSVSFAAVQYIKTQVSHSEDKNVLLLGTGKIGGNTCRNLLHYLPVKSITLMNRSDEKAALLAAELKVGFAPIQELQEAIHHADIIVVATNAEEPVLSFKDLQHHHEKLIIDLSIPNNVDVNAANLHHITLVNVDELSKVKDETLQQREAEVPKAKAIILHYLEEFLSWNEMRRHVPYLKAIKVQLQMIQTQGHAVGEGISMNRGTSHEKIQKVINGTAVKMQKYRNHGCHYIEAINEFMSPGVQ